MQRLPGAATKPPPAVLRIGLGHWASCTDPTGRVQGAARPGGDWQERIKGRWQHSSICEAAATLHRTPPTHILLQLQDRAGP